MNTTAQLQRKYELLSPLLDERQRRLWAGAEALALGRGGISRVAQATGLARMTVRAGARELLARQDDPDSALPAGQVRTPGGGRRPLTETDPMLLRDLEALVEPLTRGDPESPLRWTCKSTRKLATALQEQGHPIGPSKVGQLLREELGYRLQANRKTREGKDHPDRDAQFAYINDTTADFLRRGQPVVSVDTKKKELVGNYARAGQEWEPMSCAPEVNTHDFPDPQVGKAIPYGVYDVAANVGWVSVGIDHDTAAFAVATVRCWWDQMGYATYPEATELLVVADGGGSNGSRSRLWKLCLQRLADALGILIRVCHFPPGTSKWNKIEHRLFSEITKNWRGRPLESHQVVVNLIGSTQTEGGLRVRAALDRSGYPTGLKVSDEEFQTINLERAEFHGDWNYTIKPRNHAA